MVTTETISREVRADNIPLANRILLYLYMNPSAKDTAEGIAQWWVKEPISKVRKVLEILVDLKMVKTYNSGRSILYMLGETSLEPFIDEVLTNNGD
ncbi:hypothetical protein ACFLU6_08810 [Acidobacteriota bacterium]